MSSTTPGRSLHRLRLWGWLPHVLVGGLALPFILRQNAHFEWANTLWLLELQTAHVRAHITPTYFIDAAGMYFYPQQLFYAGPALAVLSYPALLFGAWPVFAASTVGAFSAASAGVSWTARNLGVSRRLSLLPGVLFACTPYMISDLYGRGDWAELVAAAALAVALGAASSLLTGRARSTPRTVAVIALAVATIAGAHNLTLLFAALVAPLFGLALLPGLRGSPTERLTRYALVLAGAAMGLALVGVFLVPNIWLSGRVLINSYSGELLREVTSLNRLGIIFDPLPGEPGRIGPTDLHTQTLVVAGIWCLGVTALLVWRRRLGRSTAATLGVLAFGAIVLSALISHPHWWLSFPAALQAIQFPFRLVTYLALLTVVAVAVLLAVPAVRQGRVLVSLLGLAIAWQVGLGGYLAISAASRGGPRLPAAGVHVYEPPYAYGHGQRIQYRLSQNHPLPGPVYQATVAPIGDDTPPKVELSGSQPVGSLVGTRVVASPLIRFSGGVAVAGATGDAFEVLRVNRSPWRATVTSVCTTCLRAIAGNAPLALLAGRALSAIAILIVVCLLGGPGAVRAWRRRTDHRYAAASPGRDRRAAGAETPDRARDPTAR